MAQAKRDYEWSNEELVVIAREFPDFSSPSFQLYINDFLGSSRVMVMEPAEVGAFCLLLMLEWNEKDCGLPLNQLTLAKLSRLNEAWETYGPHLMEMFFELGDRLYNRRLLQERRKQIDARQQRVGAGQASAKARGHNRLPNRTSVTPPLSARSTPAERSSDTPEVTKATRKAVGQTVFERWQEQKELVAHKAFTSDMLKNVLLWVDEYGSGALTQAVKNYAEVVGGSEYWFSYQWTFEDFFRRGSTQKPAPFKKFLTESKPLENFKNRDGVGQPSQQVELVEGDNYEHR